MSSEFYGGIIGYFLSIYCFLCMIALFTFGLQVWNVSNTINRTIPTAMQHGGVDAAVQNVVRAELEARHITVNSITGSAPGRPWGEQITMTINAKYKIWFIDQPVGQTVKATSTYNRRQ